MKAIERYRIRHKVDPNDESRTTVLLALAANLAVAVAKSVAGGLTLSASMIAEAVHSWVDVGNEYFIVRAFKTANRPADSLHPLGYGRESFVWSLFASLGTLVLGAVATIWHGVVSLRHDDGEAHYFVAYLVLAISFVVEGISFVQTYRQMRAQGETVGRGVLEHAALTSNSPLRAVFTEDLIALISLVFAAVAMALHQFTGRASFDAWGSIAIGALMAVAAIGLINSNRTFLAGRSPSPEYRTRIIDLLKASPEVARVTFVYAEFIGPDRLLIIGGVAIAGEKTQAQLAYALRNLERSMMAHKFVGLAILSLATPEEEEAPANIPPPKPSQPAQ